MAGLMMGALGGMGQAAMQSGLAMQKGGIDQELESIRSENAFNKAKALELFKADLGNQQRAERVSRVGAAQTGLINQAVDQKYAGSDAAVAAASAGQTDAPLTAEQQAVIDQSKLADRQSLENDPDIRARAALKTGDISEHDAIALNRADKQNEVANKRLDLQQSFNEQRAKFQDRIAAAAEARAGRADKRASDQADKAELNSTRMSLTAVLKDIGSEQDRLQVKMLDPMLDDKQRTLLQEHVKLLDKDRIRAREALFKLGGVDAAEPEAAPAKNGWDSGTGEVFRDGKPIGTAKTEKEARALHQNFDAKKGETETTAEKPGLINSPPAAAPSEQKPASTLDQLEASNMEALKPLAQQFKQAEQQYLAAAKSGDKESVGLYMQKKEALRTQLEQQVEAKFGNNADRVLRQLYAQ